MWHFCDVSIFLITCPFTYKPELRTFIPATFTDYFLCFFLSLQLQQIKSKVKDQFVNNIVI